MFKMTQREKDILLKYFLIYTLVFGILGITSSFLKATGAFYHQVIEKHEN